MPGRRVRIRRIYFKADRRARYRLRCGYRKTKKKKKTKTVTRANCRPTNCRYNE